MQSKIHTLRFRTEKYEKHDEENPVLDYLFSYFFQYIPKELHYKMALTILQCLFSKKCIPVFLLTDSYVILFWRKI